MYSEHSHGLNSFICVKGAVLTLGKAQRFRFNHPAEAALLRHHRPKVSMAATSRWLLGSFRTAPLASLLFLYPRSERPSAAVALWNGWTWMEMSPPQDWVSVLCFGMKGENLLLVPVESPGFASQSVVCSWQGGSHGPHLLPAWYFISLL